MRRRIKALRPVLRRHTGTLQGVFGAVAVSVGTAVLWGAGWALLVVGCILLLGAWGSA